MEFQVLGCELFGYDRSFRPVGQVSLKPGHDLVEYLRAVEKLPNITTKAQIVMFLQVGDQQVRLYSQMLPVSKGVVSSTDSIAPTEPGQADSRIRTDAGQEQTATEVLDVDQ